MECDNWVQEQGHTAKATHKIGVNGGEKWRVCEKCYEAIIAAAMAGTVSLWDCN